MSSLNPFTVRSSAELERAEPSYVEIDHEMHKTKVKGTVKPLITYQDGLSKSLKPEKGELSRTCSSYHRVSDGLT